MNVKLPESVGFSTLHTAHGRTLEIRKSSRNSYYMFIQGVPQNQIGCRRWGNASETKEDAAYYMEHGKLPCTAGKGWA